MQGAQPRRVAESNPTSGTYPADRSFPVEGGFASVWKRYARPLAYFVTASLGTAEVEDAVQEIMLKVYRGRRQFDCSRSLSAWVYAVARNHCRDARRRRARRPQEAVSEPGVVDAAAAPEELGPEEALLGAETRRLIRESLEALPHDDRQILFLHYFEGLSCAEIAAVIGRPEGTVKYRIHTAKKVLRRALEKEL